ncbi:DNA-binding transcriptional regulator, FadR family [Paenibacillus sp. UNCCL117]|uniref:FadR/GntR family transcriptional regulator n=1 Tax=unclassified Paenibacillus TaxID=185978 RepID=UPI000885F107|nr:MULTISPECIES: FCD domain-containing protein [unclassified Paenibacillus]SDE20322.1 DNA-binding transcriptional regulator, FadR family [Paenibacillus sp. cl123]SFW61789.1 DNA-binding transcriptional regulator, FadR family [Paenibacillus sp. UNCCL117]
MMKKTAFQLTVDTIKSKISEGHWAPGERLPTLQQLTKELSVSITTVREALRSLENEGIVSIEHGRGMYVRNDPLLLEDPTAALKELDDVSLLSLLEARLLIEPELAALCARKATESQVKRLRQLADRMIRQMGEGGPFLQTDLEFHQLIAEGARHPVLERMLDSITPLLAGGRKQTNTLPHMRTKASNYHSLIAIAIEERQEERARRLMFDHISDMIVPLQSPRV